MPHYVPEKEILEKYADVMVNFALWDGRGIRPGEVVLLVVPEAAKPILEPLQVAILKAGGHSILKYTPTDREGVTRAFYEHAEDHQLEFQPEEYLTKEVEAVDHILFIMASHDKYYLQGVDPDKIMRHKQAKKFYWDARKKKEDAGKQSWSICLYGTPAMAKDVELSAEEYWQEIIKACFLDLDDPKAKWIEIKKEIETTLEWLNSHDIDTLHMEGDDMDLHISLGEKRKWKGGAGANIPSFEIFTSPDWRGTNGWIKFNQPLYRYGDKITGIKLEFKDGVVVRATADKNEKLLKSMIDIPNMDKIGEYSLTDKRMSRISRFMGETLFDENMGGEYGNTHIALGLSFSDTYTGEAADMSDDDWAALGFNKSAEHVDIISTADRTVTATLNDGSRKTIYKNGEFQI